MQIIVQPGDTFWNYSQMFGIPLPLIIDSNRGLDSMNIQPGQQVNIPGFIMQPHTIQQGDTFFTLANRYHIPLQHLLFVNRMIAPENLQIGMIIQLPIRVTWKTVSEVQSYDDEKMTTDIQNLLTIYPFLLHNIIGESVMKKPLHEIVVGNGTKRVHVNGSFHANEWLTTPLIMHFLNDYLLRLTNGSNAQNLNYLHLYETTRLSLVPMVNPDGVNLVIHGVPPEEPYRATVLELNNGNTDFSGWKANIRGVDLNNQFPAKWEIEKERKPQHPGPRDYPGEQPLSEPEALAMANLTRQSQVARVLAFHSQGKEIYWGFEGFEPPESEVIVQEFARVSGYTPVRYLDSYAGYKDWFIQEFRRPGFTIEVGIGVNPLPITQFDDIYRDNSRILFASLYM